DVLADARADLDDRLVHLGLHLLLHPPLALMDELCLDVRAQIEGDGIDRLVFLFDADGEGGFVHRNWLHRIGAGWGGASAFFTAIPATASTIHLKLSGPTDLSSASGAGFMKSMAYGTPSSTANSTVLRSYPSARQTVMASRRTRSMSAGS